MVKSSSKDLVFDSSELIKISDTLITTIDQLSNAYISGFSKMQANPFYILGKAKEEVDRIVLQDSRGDFGRSDLSFVLGVAGDYYGKLQMLSQYYSILSEYCFTVMIEVQEKDEEIVRYINQLQSGLIGGD